MKVTTYSDPQHFAVTTLYNIFKIDVAVVEIFKIVTDRLTYLSIIGAK